MERSGSLLLAAALWLTAAGCGQVLGFEEYKPGAASLSLGTTCSVADDCNGLTCVAGRCRAVCERDTDCGNNICLEGRGCALESERCATAGEACESSALICGLDGVCRTPCTGPCDGPGQACIQGACVSPDEATATDLGWFTCVPGCVGTTLTACNTVLPGENESFCATEELCDAGVSSGQCGEPGGCVEGEASCDDAKNVLLCKGGVVSMVAGPCDLCTETAAAVEVDPSRTTCVPACSATENLCEGDSAKECIPNTSGLDTTVCTGAEAQCKPAGGCFALAIDATEVTRGAYETWLASIPVFTADARCPGKVDYTPDAACLATVSCTGGVAVGCDAAHPQTCVDWCDAAAYCAAHGQHLCSRMGGDTLSPDDADDPNLSEWYNACSSGGQFDTAVGDTVNVEVGTLCHWDVNNMALHPASGGTCKSPVVGYATFVNLSGNAAEWQGACDDVLCTVRGGSSAALTDNDFDCDEVKELLPTTHDPFVGFRCCGP